MSAPKNPKTQKTEVTLTFGRNDLSQLEAFAALHGTTVAAFIQNAALEAARITSTKKSPVSKPNDPSALWLTDVFADAPEEKEEEASELFASPAAPVDAQKEPETVAPSAVASELKPKRGIVGEQSQLAKGHGLVWEVRRNTRKAHGLGWTREQLAFVLKLSVVGVRKMEHLGTSPVKSLEARKKLLELSKTLENPGKEMANYIERKEAALGSMLKAGFGGEKFQTEVFFHDTRTRPLCVKRYFIP